jgi:histone deacetylase 6
MSGDDILHSVPYYEGLSLYVSPSTTAAAKLSCGGVVDACRAVVKGEVRNSFAIVRPPGHHAEPDEHMGFCFFNNAAVAARVVQEELGVKKVLILDWWVISSRLCTQY